MKNVNVLVSNIGFTSKPIQSKTGKIKKSFFNPNETTTSETLESLTNKIKKGYSINAAFVIKSEKDNKAPSKNSTFISQEIWMVDIDNHTIDAKHPQGIDTNLTTDTLLKISNKYNGLSPFIIYETFSSTTTCPRFRIGFCTTSPITNRKTRDQAMKGLIGLFIKEGYKYVDTRCVDISRLFYGTTADKIRYTDTNALINTETFKSTVQPFIRTYETATRKTIQKKKITPRQTYLTTKLPTNTTPFLQKPDKIQNTNIYLNVKYKNVLIPVYHRVFEEGCCIATLFTFYDMYAGNDPFYQVNDTFYRRELHSVLDERYVEANQVSFEVFSTYACDGSFFCCEFHDDKEPSAHIFITDSGEQRYKCFGCDIALSPVEYVSRSKRISKIEAIDYILRRSRAHMITKLNDAFNKLNEMGVISYLEEYKALGFNRSHSDEILKIAIDVAIGTGVIRGQEIFFPLSGSVVKSFLVKNHMSYMSYGLDSIQQKLKRIVTYKCLLREVSDHELQEKVPASFSYFKKEQVQKSHNRRCGWFAISLDVVFEDVLHNSVTIAKQMKNDGVRGPISRDSVLLHKGEDEANKVFVQDQGRDLSKVVSILYPLFTSIIREQISENGWLTESVVLDVFFSKSEYSAWVAQMKYNTVKYALHKCWSRLLEKLDLEWKIINKDLRNRLTIPNTIARGSKILFKKVVTEVQDIKEVVQDTTEAVVKKTADIILFPIGLITTRARIKGRAYRMVVLDSRRLNHLERMQSLNYKFTHSLSYSLDINFKLKSVCSS